MNPLNLYYDKFYNIKVSPTIRKVTVHIIIYLGAIIVKIMNLTIERK